jgi:outer membrane receptor for ferrienterochelin and colicins
MNSPCATSSWRGLRSLLLESFTGENAQSFNLAGDWQINDRKAMQARAYFTRFDEITNGFLLPSGAPSRPGNLFERLGEAGALFSRIRGERQFIQGGAEWAPNTYGGINRLQNDNCNDIDFESVWARDRVSLADRTTVTLGLRFDNHSIFGSAVSPKAGLNLRVTDYWRIRASYGRGFRAPDLGQLFYRFLNPTNFYHVIGNPMGAGAQEKREWRRGGASLLAPSAGRNEDCEVNPASAPPVN